MAAEPAAKSSTPPNDQLQGRPWTNGELAVIESKLSPASLCFSRARTLSFFTGLNELQAGGPMFVAISTEQGPKIFKPGERIEPARLRESWFVAWFSGARGWTNWDVPWFLTLQHRPKTIRFDTNGLHFTFDGAAGYAALMPLYGADKPLPAGQESSPFAALKEKKKRVLTWEWHKALPADPLARARYWASALREFPIAVSEAFSIDRAHDSITIEESYRWLSWSDDWNTKAMKLAPVSPVLAHAYKEAFPAEFSRKPFDMEIFTDYGPYYGIEGADSYRVTLPVLRYVHETAGAGEPAGEKLDAPCFAAWQKAHGSNQWDWLIKAWPDLRTAFRARAATCWPAFASANGPPLDRTADALGAARIAYRLRDMETYGLAAHCFARALVQLTAQQRGLNYFHEHQPWRSMKPLEAGATLAVMDAAGWRTGKGVPASAVAGVPDLARLLRDTLPPSPERLLASAPALERLIPGSVATPFFPHELVGSNSSGGLVQTLNASPPGPVDGAASWPQIIWPAWPAAAGRPWSFGQITTSPSALQKAEVIEVNPATRMILIPAH